MHPSNRIECGAKKINREQKNIWKQIYEGKMLSGRKGTNHAVHNCRIIFQKVEENKYFVTGNAIEVLPFSTLFSQKMLEDKLQRSKQEMKRHRI